jgi:O-antigen/teichoic acid export membrane protein
MGVVQRQGFKYSIVNFIGVGIGIISILFIYPNALEIVGLFRVLFDASVLATILVLLGSPTSAVRFFPKYRDDATSHRGLLSWLLIVYATGFILFLIFFPVIHQLMTKWIFRDRNQMFSDFIIYVIPLTFCVGLINLLARYISNFRRIVIPSAFENLTIKIALPLIILMYLQGWINVEGVVIGIVVSYILATIGTSFYLFRLGHYKLTRPEILYDREALKEYTKFSWYSILAGIGSQVAFRIDNLMVSGMIQLQAGGIYTIAWTVSDVIAKPLRALSAITGPMIAEHIEKEQWEEVNILYKKSSLNMSIIGLGLFLAIWQVLPFIFEIMPNTEVMQSGAYVIFFLGLAQVWDMMTGVNGEIIMYSKYYRFNLYLTLFLAVINILANLLLIRKFGITGAALATCISFFLYNVVKYLFILIKFGFQPFSSKLIPVVAFGIGSWLIARWLPVVNDPWINLIYKGSVFGLLYGFAVWRLRLSPDINDWLEKSLQKVFKSKTA